MQGVEVVLSYLGQEDLFLEVVQSVEKHLGRLMQSTGQAQVLPVGQVANQVLQRHHPVLHLVFSQRHERVVHHGNEAVLHLPVELGPKGGSHGPD